MESVLELLPKPGEDRFDAAFDARIRKKVDAVRTLKRVLPGCLQHIEGALDIIEAVEKEDKEAKDGD